MSDRLRDALDAWMEGDDEIADIGVIVQAARKALAGPSPEAVQAAAEVIRAWSYESATHVAAAALAAAWAHDFGGEG